MNFLKSLFNPSYGYARGIIGIILGLVLVIFPSATVKALVWIVGGTITLSGIVSLITFYGHKRKIERGGETMKAYSDDRILMVTGVLATVLGIILMCFNRVLIDFIVIILGVLLIVMAIFQAVNLVKVSKTSGLKLWFFLFPVVTLVFGIICSTRPRGAVDGLIILLGVGVLVGGVSEIVSVIKLSSALNKKVSE